MKAIKKYGLICFTQVILFNGCFFETSIVERDPSAGFNGSFEKTKHQLPLNWTIYAAVDYQKNYYLSFDTLFAKEGKQSLKFEVHSIDSSYINQAWRRPGLSQRIDANKGDTFKVSFWVKNSECKFVVKVGVPGGERNWNDIVNAPNNFVEWTYFEQDYTVPGHFPFFLFELNILSPGTFWIDDIKIDKLSD